MSKKQWYKDHWDKYVFNAGVQARNNGIQVACNPFDLQEDSIDYALWLMGWTYANMCLMTNPYDGPML